MDAKEIFRTTLQILLDPTKFPGTTVLFTTLKYIEYNKPLFVVYCSSFLSHRNDTEAASLIFNSFKYGLINIPRVDIFDVAYTYSLPEKQSALALYFKIK